MWKIWKVSIVLTALLIWGAAALWGFKKANDSRELDTLFLVNAINFVLVLLILD